MATLAERFPFVRFCQLLDDVQATSKHSIKMKKVNRFVQEAQLRVFGSSNRPDLPHGKEWRDSGDDFFPALRLLLPHLDKDRATYGMKDKLLATAFIEALSIAGSADAAALMNWRKPRANGHVAGDFGEVLYSVLRSRAASVRGALTIAEVNEQLDRLNSCDTNPERKAVIGFFATHCGPVEQKWIARIIMKEMKLGVTQTTVFRVWHPEAEDMFNVCSSLQRVATQLKDLKAVWATKDVILGTPFKPMLAKSCTQLTRVESIMKGEVFWIQTKLDGERIQLHKDENRYAWFSRNAKDYTFLYGETAEEKFAKCIHNSFRPEISSCILDGEMMSYCPETGLFEGFGGLKTAANRLNEQGDVNAQTRPCYVVFDVININGTSLTDQPLKDRYRLLERVFEPRPTYLELLDYEEGQTTQHVVEGLDRRMIDHLEGILIKNPAALYRLNERGEEWLKIKPDYIDNLGDDVDLVLVGGFFGTGRRSGKLSHFMCAVLDRGGDDGGGGGRYVTFCKFGSGYTLAEIEEITHEGEGHWRVYDPKRPPPWFVHPPGSKEKPDMILHPDYSRVVCIKAAEIVKSDQYGVGFTLRFPRFVRIRHDKSVSEAMSTTDLQSYIVRNKGRMQSRRLELDDNRVTKKARHVTSKAIKASVPLEYRAAVAGVERESDVLEGVEVCVIPGSVPGPDGACLKPTLEALTVRLGVARVANQFGKYDVVKSRWLYDCAKYHRKVPLQPRHILHATEDTKSTLTRTNDKFGDSYTEKVTTETLKECFNLIDAPREMTEEMLLSLQMEVDEKYFEFTPVFGALFRGKVFYLDKGDVLDFTADMFDDEKAAPATRPPITKHGNAGPYKPSPNDPPTLPSIASRIICWGGRVHNCVSRGTTHIVLVHSVDLDERERKERLRSRRAEVMTALLGYSDRNERRPHVVAEEWVRESIASNSLRNEEEF
ncbi:DNA ligase (ATP) [Phlyctochytrium bullatum]|nr:DNA ligase (ATP) [Phlyctochytrium bullatum]